MRIYEPLSLLILKCFTVKGTTVSICLTKLNDVTVNFPELCVQKNIRLQHSPKYILQPAQMQGGRKRKINPTDVGLCRPCEQAHPDQVNNPLITTYHARNTDRSKKTSRENVDMLK